MNYGIVTTNRFEKALKKCIRRGKDMGKIKAAISCLAENGELPASYRPHKLAGDYAGCWECHIEPDWLMVWRQNDIELTLLFLDTGNHSDLF